MTRLILILRARLATHLATPALTRRMATQT